MKSIADYRALFESAGSVYQPLEHPAFQDLECLQPCTERWEFIRSVDLPPMGLCVDIGCHTGWFCRKFSQLGWDVIGLDTSGDMLDLARTIMKPYEGPSSPAYVQSDIADFVLPQADVILCLSVVMYWFNPQFGKTEEEGWSFLRNISRASPRMFLDFGGQYDVLPETFPSDVLDHTEYDQHALLGTTALSRPFWFFSRSA